MTSELENKSIGEIVAENYRAADVFKKYGIDFCCGGKKSLSSVCDAKGLNAKAIRDELQSVADLPVSGYQDYSHWDPAFLADYIVNTHHLYAHNAMPDILEYTQKVARVHGKTHPETIEIADLFLQIMEEMITHMEKEEKILFPFVKKLSNARSTGVMPLALFGSVQNPVTMMEHEHDAVGDMIKRIIELSNNFTPPADACNTFKVAYAKLKEFTEDIFKHMHLENNVLFPEALEMEKQLKKSA